ncbi:DUF4326 domain-containing protein [Luteimonas sp. TWI1416]|uniref:DUF4326 domain-containing protein n=1 Tax=unclassified Luteimonas TaxID=2629088 RepID=UPI003208C3B9
MTTPVRLRLSRRRGFDLQAHSHAVNGLPATVVARPGRWGNPYRIGVDGDRAICVARYAAHMATCADAPDLAPLRGRNLACWCPLDGPCHADVLLALANPEQRAPHDRS